MATQLSIVNSILERLREDPVSSVGDNAYARLIAQFVNDAKADLEDMNHTWSVYITEVDTTILADDSTIEYDIAETNDRSFLMRSWRDDRVPAAYDITVSEVQQLCDMPYKVLKAEQNLTIDGNTTTKYPRFFAIQPQADGDGWTIEIIYPVASTDSARSWRMYWYIPQDDLALDGSSDSTNILLPKRPIELRAVYYALNERGEEMGEPGGIAAERASVAVAAALETDMQVQKKSDEIDIENHEFI